MNSINQLNIMKMPKEVEGAMELALIRPDLVTEAQINLLAQELKNRPTNYLGQYQGGDPNTGLGNSFGSLSTGCGQQASFDPAGVIHLKS